MNNSGRLVAKFNEIRANFDFSPLREHLRLNGLAFSEEEADDLIQAFLQFFCLHEINREGVPLSNPVGILDEVLHHFILNDTEQYINFCLRFFGKMIHHSHFTSCARNVDESPQMEGPSKRVRRMLKLYKGKLHPLLKTWIAHCETLEGLSDGERQRTQKMRRLRNLIYQAEACNREARKIMESLEGA